MTAGWVFRHPDGRVCRLDDLGRWHVAENPANRGVVGLGCLLPHDDDPWPGDPV